MFQFFDVYELAFIILLPLTIIIIIISVHLFIYELAG